MTTAVISSVSPIENHGANHGALEPVNQERARLREIHHSTERTVK